MIWFFIWNILRNLFFKVLKLINDLNKVAEHKIDHSTLAVNLRYRDRKGFSKNTSKNSRALFHSYQWWWGSQRRDGLTKDCWASGLSLYCYPWRLRKSGLSWSTWSSCNPSWLYMSREEKCRELIWTTFFFLLWNLAINERDIWEVKRRIH